MYKFTLSFVGDFEDLSNVLSSINHDVSETLSMVCEYMAKSATATNPEDGERYRLMAEGAKEHAKYFKELVESIEVKQEVLDVTET